MKTIGLLGGMSWESTVHYYQIINREVKKRLGGTHSGKILVNSVDFFEIDQLQHQNKWDDLTKIMIDETKKLVRAGADCIVICTNTMHKMADDIIENISIPLIHIADATAEAIEQVNYHDIALLGTKFTMEQDFYKGRLENLYDLKVVVPNEEDRDEVHDIIYDELVLGIINETSKSKYIEIINKMASDVEGVILGCTEIGMLVKPGDVSLPLFDTTEIHALAAVDFALADD